MQRTLANDPASRLTGCLLMVAGVFCFALLDASAKYLSADYPVGQIVFIRNLGGLIFALILFVPRKGTAIFRSRRPVFQIGRGLLLLGTTSCNFVALSYLPLAQNAAILYTAPLFVCALSVPLLGEKVGWRRWSAIALGFGGMLLIIRPGFEAVHWAVILALAAAVQVALYNISARTVAAYDDAATTLFYITLTATLGSFPAILFDWRTPEGIDLLLFCLIGLFGSFGHYLLTYAHGLAPASTLAPFVYVQIVFMAILGYLIFAHLPTIHTWIGAAVVVASGLYLGYRERKVKAVKDLAAA